MIIISDSYKKRLSFLAGIISEVEAPSQNNNYGQEDPFKGFENRVKFDKDLMVKAIREGWEVGLLFFSKNDKYQARTYKARIIYPVAMGISKKGNPVIRGFHKLGQSEIAGIKKKAKGEKNWRSAEASNEWRMFKVSNISRMWLTGNFFKISDAIDSQNGAKYSTSKDKGMKIVEIQYNKSVADKFQKEYNQSKKEKEQPQVKTVTVGKKPDENTQGSKQATPGSQAQGQDMQAGQDNSQQTNQQK